MDRIITYTIDSTNFKKSLKERLRNTGLNIDEFLEVVKESNCIIAGGLILQVYSRQNWEESDMDIFAFGDCLVETYLTKQKFDKTVHVSNLKNNYEGYTAERICEYITPTGFKIQVMWSTGYEKKAVDYLDKFDFEFCKIGYDGKDLSIVGYDAIQNKYSNFDFEKRTPTGTTYKRLIKYEKRGFHITNKNELIEKILKNELNRQNFSFEYIEKLQKDSKQLEKINEMLEKGERIESVAIY